MKTTCSKLYVPAFLLLAQALVISCSGQNRQEIRHGGSKPDVRINVKTVRDKNGRVIRYDSSYRYSYSGGNFSKADSFMTTLPWFYKNLRRNPFYWPPDSLFFRNGYFSPLNLHRPFEWHEKMFEQMHKRQDRWRKDIFYEQSKKPAGKVI